MKITPEELSQILGIDIHKVCKRDEVKGTYIHEECYKRLKSLAEMKGIMISYTRFGAPLNYVQIILKKK